MNPGNGIGSRFAQMSTGDMQSYPNLAGRIPRVRIIVLTYAGAAHLEETLSSVMATDWPVDLLDVVVIDNGSSDGSGSIAARLGARVHRSDRNLGFPANNLELVPDEADVFVLLNDDVSVFDDWLRPLIECLEAGRMHPPRPGCRVGAVQPTLVFAQTYGRVVLDRSVVDRDLEEVRVGEFDATLDCHPIRGLTGRNPDGRSRTITAEAEILVPIHEADEVSVHVSDGRSIRFAPPSERIVQNAGIELTAEVFGRDRLEWTALEVIDPTPTEIFGFCGGAVAITAEFIRDVGTLEPSLFLYYEDLDLSWRGRLRGWTYLHVPASTVLHRHAATVGAQSPLHRHWSTRNRLLVLTRLADRATAQAAWVGEIRGAGWHIRSAMRSASGQTDRWAEPRWRMRSLLSAYRALPRALWARRRLRTSSEESRVAEVDRSVHDWFAAISGGSSTKC